MEKTDTQGNITFLWNDVAVMDDENCAFVIMKAMVKLSRGLPEILTMEKIAVESITKAMTRGDSGEAISGDLHLAVQYETTDNELAELRFAVPFAGDYRGTAEVANTPQAVYVDAQAVGFSNLLLEAVLSVPNKSRLWRSEDVIIGHFQAQHRLTLPEQWPPLAQIIAAKVDYQLQDCQKEQDALHLRGRQTTAILYAAAQNAGEKIMLYQSEEPLEVTVPTKVALLRADQLLVGYYSLTAQANGQRDIMLDCNCSIGTDRANLAPLEPTALAEDEPAAPAAEARAQEPPALAAPKAAAAPPAAPNQAPAAVKTFTPPTAKSRPSRRDHLLKHMRSLDCGVRTPKCSRSIPLAPEETPAPPPAAEEQ